MSHDLLNNRIAVAIPTIEGWCPIEKAQRMAKAIIETKCDLSVELGVFGGRGVISMAMAHNEIGNGISWGFDPWEKSASLDGDIGEEHVKWWTKLDHEAIYKKFVQSVLKHDVLERCRWTRIKSEQASKIFDDESIGVIHADSNHSEKVSSDEVLRWSPKIKHGGYWFADDIDWPTTKLAQELLPKNGFKLIENHVKWAVYKKD